MLSGRGGRRETDLDNESDVRCGVYFVGVGGHRDLHAFPTRRSSDVVVVVWWWALETRDEQSGEDPGWWWWWGGGGGGGCATNKPEASAVGGVGGDTGRANCNTTATTPTCTPSVDAATTDDPT